MTINTGTEATQAAVMRMAGIGIQAMLHELDTRGDDLKRQQDELTARNDRARANLDKLDRITLQLCILADELTQHGGKIRARKLAKQILRIRDGR